jgi:hypothetical protein
MPPATRSYDVNDQGQVPGCTLGDGSPPHAQVEATVSQGAAPKFSAKVPPHTPLYHHCHYHESGEETAGMARLASWSSL